MTNVARIQYDLFAVSQGLAVYILNITAFSKCWASPGDLGDIEPNNRPASAKSCKGGI